MANSSSAAKISRGLKYTVFKLDCCQFIRKKMRPALVA